MKIFEIVFVLSVVLGALSMSAMSESDTVYAKQVTDLWLDEVEGNSGSQLSEAIKTFDPVNCSGLTPQNGTFVIDIKWESSADRLDAGAIHIGTDASNYWRGVITDLLNSNAPGEWHSYEIPMEDWITTAGTVDVSSFGYIRVATWVTGQDSPTSQVWWRNARIEWEAEIVGEIPDSEVVDEITGTDLASKKQDERVEIIQSYATRVTDIALNSTTLDPRLRQFVY